MATTVIFSLNTVFSLCRWRRVALVDLIQDVCKQIDRGGAGVAVVTGIDGVLLVM